MFAGCSAAIAAARAGANTILIERFGILGGIMNVSGPPGWAYSHLFNNHGETIIAGIVEETHHRLEPDLRHRAGELIQRVRIHSEPGLLSGPMSRHRTHPRWRGPAFWSSRRR
jgi:NADPH-dependent 2,4-dienoyl-CoA reductase/sulfur reductase-like enzyme